MTETSQAPEPAAPSPAAPEGPIGHVADWFRSHGEHAEAGVAHLAADVGAALRDHAGSVYDFAGDFLGVLKLIDPADAPLITAAEALVPKMLAMVEKATALAQGALKS